MQEGEAADRWGRWRVEDVLQVEQRRSRRGRAAWWVKLRWVGARGWERLVATVDGTDFFLVTKAEARAMGGPAVQQRRERARGERRTARRLAIGAARMRGAEQAGGEAMGDADGLGDGSSRASARGGEEAEGTRSATRSGRRALLCAGPGLACLGPPYPTLDEVESVLYACVSRVPLQTCPCAPPLSRPCVACEPSLC